MNLLADENIDRAIVNSLREAGHDVLWIAEVAPAADDPDVLSLGHSFGRVLLTFDVGIGAQSFRRRQNPPTIVIVRVKYDSRAELLDAFARAWTLAGPAVESGKLITAYVNRVRVRTLPTP